MKKKYLFVAESLGFGGVEKSLLELLKVLNRDKNIDIDLFLFNESGIYLEEIKKMGINIMSFDYKTQLFLLPYREFLKLIFQNKNLILLFRYIFKIIKVYFNGKRRNLGNKLRFSIIDKINLNLNKEYDLAVAYSGRHLLYFVDKYVKANKKITYIHGDVSKINFTIEEMSTSYKNMDNIICVSEKVLYSMQEKLPEFKKKMNVIYNLIDYEKINELKKEKVYEMDENNLNFVSVGRLSTEKNYLWLVKKIENIIKKENNSNSKKVKLYIIGNGPEYKKIKKYIIKNKLNQNIYLLGYNTNPYKYINMADFYLQPSISEGFCITIYEAYYLKKIILANNFADIKFLISDGIDGLIAQNNDDFVNKLDYLINNYKEVKRLSKNIKDINNDNTIKQIKKIYGCDSI